MKNKIYIFDLDDTLLECSANYSKIIAEYINMMVKEFDRLVPHPIDIAEKQQRIDQELIGSQSYTKDRFPLSFVETYKYFHDLHYPNEKYNYEFIDKVYKLGYSIFDIIPREIPNAYNLLRRMKDNNIPMYILTAGDKEPQNFKISSTRIKEFFIEENIFINNVKGENEFNEVIKKIQIDHPGTNKDDIVMIGDSLRNDINPAVSLGLNAIYLNVVSWSYNKVDVEGKYTILNNLYELEDYIFSN